MIQLRSVTISEHLQLRIRAYQRIKWAGVLVLVIMAFVQVTLEHSDAELYAWMAVIAAPWLVAASVIGKRVRCPRCQKNLFRELAYSIATPLTLLRDFKREVIGRDPVALEACPHCGCKFSEPYVGQ
jgi:hypothetical protein